MTEQIESFIGEVLNGMVIDDPLKKRIAQDLRSHITEASRNQSVDEVLGKMGSPTEVAREFMESVYEDKSEVIERLIRERLKVNQLLRSYYEYRSKTQIFSLPLIHIKYRRHLKAKPGIAKGIVAIGNRAIGVVAIGKYSYGGLCFGMGAFGLLTCGFLSAGVIALGSFSAGVIALGGFVVGLSAFGGFALGLISGGGFVRGVVAMGGHMTGQFIGNPASAYQIKALILQAYPHLNDWILNVLVFFKFFYT